MFWGCFGCFGMFRMFWGVLDKLLHFNLNIRLCCEQLGGGVHLFWGGVFCTYGPPYLSHFVEMSPTIRNREK